MTTLLISVQSDLDVIGLRALHEFLLARGEDSTLVFMPTLDDEQEGTLRGLDRFVAERKPLIAGVSLMSPEHQNAATVTSMLRARHPGLPIVWGGVHPTCDPENSLESADWICVGEGETSMLDLVRAAREGRSFKDIPNIGWMEDGVYRQNPPYPLVQNLDTLPPLSRIPRNAHVALPSGVVPLDEPVFRRYARYMGRNYATITSRGCPYECAYCVNSLYTRLYPGWKVRRRSVDHLIGELERVVSESPDIVYVNFHDDCFLACGMEYLREFREKYKARVGRRFIARTAPAYVTEERLELLKDAGLSWVSVGLQSGSDRVCREVFCRRSTREKFLQAAALIHRFKIAAFYDFIFDNPWESEEETLETVTAIMETPKPYHAELFSLVFYKGSALRRRAEEEGLPILEDPRKKDYFILQRRRINDLAETAVKLPLFLMKPLLAQYRRNPDALLTRILLQSAKWSCRLFFTPISYFQLIQMSHGGSLRETAAVLPMYFKTAFSRYYLRQITRTKSTE